MSSYTKLTVVHRGTKKDIASKQDLIRITPESEADNHDFTAYATIHNCPNDPRDIEALSRQFVASACMYKALSEILNYSGGAENALEDEYVMERAFAALSKASPLGGNDE